jgi:hypothetical protein
MNMRGLIFLVGLALLGVAFYYLAYAKKVYDDARFCDEQARIGNNNFVLNTSWAAEAELRWRETWTFGAIGSAALVAGVGVFVYFFCTRRKTALVRRPAPPPDRLPPRGTNPGEQPPT